MSIFWDLNFETVGLNPTLDYSMKSESLTKSDTVSLSGPFISMRDEPLCLLVDFLISISYGSSTSNLEQSVISVRVARGSYSKPPKQFKQVVLIFRHDGILFF